MKDVTEVVWTDTHRGHDYVFTRNLVRKRSHNTKQTLWMKTDDVVVGYICYWYDPSLKDDNTYRLVLESIEVRPGYQGQGLAKFMIDSVQKNLNETMHTTGSFTPKGYATLAGYLPLVDDSERNSIEFEDIAFVKDWDNTQTFRWVR